MPINFPDLVYRPCYDTFARVAIFNPIVSQSNAPQFTGRGIYSIAPIDVAAEEGSIVSDTEIILDVLEEEFDVVPKQGDEVTLPGDIGNPDVGTFEIIDTKQNGGGETTLTLRHKVVAKP